MSRRTTNEPLDERHDGKTCSYDVPQNDGAQYLPHDQLYDDEYDENNINGGAGLTKPVNKTTMIDGAALVDIDEATEGVDKVGYSQSAAQNETAAERVARLDRERAELVARRRQYSNPIQRAFAKVVPYGGLLSCGLNLAACSIGAGIISLSSAFQISGLVMGLIYLVAIAYLSVFSYTCIGVAGMRTGIRSYEKIVYALLGKGADYWLAFCL